MARPVKLRYVAALPGASFFKPAGIPAALLQLVRLSLEEIEAIRLKDLEGLEQEECAEKMQISRPTFHRVLESGRKKLADALVNGKAIQIGGGNFGLPSSVSGAVTTGMSGMSLLRFWRADCLYPVLHVPA